MLINRQSRIRFGVRALEDALLQYRAKLNRLQRFWIPLQMHAPLCVLILWVFGVILCLGMGSYYPCLIIAPVIVVLIVAEIVIEEVHTDLLLMTEETRNLLCLARNNYTKANAYSISDFLSGSYPRSRSPYS